MQIESATVDGNVVLTQQPAAKAGVAQPVLRATAGHADYDSAGQWMQLTRSPRVTDGGLELTADKLNVSQESGDAFAQGHVKATWTGDPEGSANSAKTGGSEKLNANFGAQGPTHVIAEQAELKRATGTATFKGNARLWQQGNSIAAPVIVLDRTKQTLTAETKDPQKSCAGCDGECGGDRPGQGGSAEAGRTVGDSGARGRSEIFERGAEGCDARGCGGKRGREHRGCDDDVEGTGVDSAASG